MDNVRIDTEYRVYSEGDLYKNHDQHTLGDEGAPFCSHCKEGVGPPG